MSGSDEFVESSFHANTWKGDSWAIMSWFFIHFKLYVSEQRDPDKIAQTHMLSWTFADHICH